MKHSNYLLAYYRIPDKVIHMKRRSSLLRWPVDIELKRRGQLYTSDMPDLISYMKITRE